MLLSLLLALCAGCHSANHSGQSYSETPVVFLHLPSSTAELYAGSAVVLADDTVVSSSHVLPVSSGTAIVSTVHSKSEPVRFTVIDSGLGEDHRDIWQSGDAPPLDERANDWCLVRFEQPILRGLPQLTGELAPPPKLHEEVTVIGWRLLDHGRLSCDLVRGRVVRVDPSGISWLLPSERHLSPDRYQGMSGGVVLYRPGHSRAPQWAGVCSEVGMSEHGPVIGFVRPRLSKR